MAEHKQIQSNWSIEQSDGVVRLVLTGDWVTGSASHTPELPVGAGTLTVSAAKLGRWDGTLAAFLYAVRCQCRRQGVEFVCEALPDGLAKLLRLSDSAPDTPPKPYVPGFLERCGIGTTEVVAAFLVGMEFTGALIRAFGRLLRRRARMQWRDVLSEIIKAGPDAVGIVCLIGFLMGLILAFIGSIPLKWFHAEVYVSSLIGIGMFRLMGAVMTGVVMAGRTGAAYAAELGTMQVNEEIDALESMDIPPMEFLVLPRFIALTLMMPLLCMFANLAGVLGGMVVGIFYLDLTYLEYWSKLADTTRLSDLFVGLFTSFVFGNLVAICGCLRGLRCGRSSEAVGQATTAAMVSSIICLVISTSLITVATVILGI